MAFNRSDIRFGNRYQRQVETNEDKGGARGPSFMDYRGCKLKFYKLGKVGDYQDINILPWKVGGSKHPLVKSGEMKPGMWDYVLDVWVHRNIGPDKGSYLCPKKTYGKSCPICDEASRLADNEGTQAAAGMWASRRSVYLVQEVDEKGRGGNEPLIFETSHNTFTKDLVDESTACMRGQGVVDYANPGPDGRVVSFRVGEDTMGGGRTYKLAKSFSFNKRQEEIPDEVLEACPSLDEMLVVPTPEQLNKALFGGPDEEPQDEPQGRRSYREEAQDDRRDYERDREHDRSSRDEEPRQRDRDDGYRGEPEPSRSEGRTLRGNDGKDFEDPFPDQPTGLSRGRDSRQDEPQEPRQERSRRDEPQDEPEPSRGRQCEPEPEQENPCPNKYQFGVECDKKALCYKCPDAIYNRCREASRRR